MNGNCRKNKLVPCTPTPPPTFSSLRPLRPTLDRAEKLSVCHAASLKPGTEQRFLFFVFFSYDRESVGDGRASSLLSLSQHCHVVPSSAVCELHLKVGKINQIHSDWFCSLILFCRLQFCQLVLLKQIPTRCWCYVTSQC